MYEFTYVVLENGYPQFYLTVNADEKEEADEMVERILLEDYPQEMEDMLFTWEIENLPSSLSGTLKGAHHA